MRHVTITGDAKGQCGEKWETGVRRADQRERKRKPGGVISFLNSQEDRQGGLKRQKGFAMGGRHGGGKGRAFSGLFGWGADRGIFGK